MSKKKSTNKEIHQKGELSEDQNKQNVETFHDHTEAKEEKIEVNQPAVEQTPETQTKKSDQSEFASEDVEQNKYVAVFSYLSILVLIPLLLKRDSAFCQKHAKQGLVWLAFLLVTSFCYFIPFLNILYALVVIVVTITCFVKTLQGKYWPIPLISQWAEKINL